MKNVKYKRFNNVLKIKTILITGGTGSFGRAFLSYLIKNYSGFRKQLFLAGMS